MQSQATLSGLPFELRAQILTHLIVAHCDPPANVFSDVPRVGADYNIALPCTLPASSGVSLLLVNRQIHAEVKQLLEDLKTRHEDLIELDVMIRGYWLYPTFTRLPLLQRDVSLPLNITLRAFSTEMLLSARLTGWMEDLLRVFMLFGPRLGSEQAAADETLPLYKISKLTVRLEYYDLYTSTTWLKATEALQNDLQWMAVGGWLWSHADSVRFVTGPEDKGRDYEWTVLEGENTTYLLEEWRQR